MQRNKAGPCLFRIEEIGKIMAGGFWRTDNESDAVASLLNLSYVFPLDDYGPFKEENPSQPSSRKWTSVQSSREVVVHAVILE